MSPVTRKTKLDKLHVLMLLYYAGSDAGMPEASVGDGLSLLLLDKRKPKQQRADQAS